MRDLTKDLEICQRATPGPWEIRREDIGDENALIVPIEIHGANGFPVVSYEGGLAPDCNWKGETIEANAKFIAEAREGWPEAIKRAIKAERENAELTKVIDTIIEDHLKMICCCPDGTIDCGEDCNRCWKEYWFKKVREEK